MDNKENRIMMQNFEWYLKADKKHWNRVAKRAKELAQNGVTAVWLPPAYKGAAGVSDVGYAVYDLYDLGEFDQKNTIATKYGTKDEYLEAIKALQGEGIEVLADIVLGHRMGADEKERIFAYGQDEFDRNREIAGKRKITVWTKFTFPGRKGKYSDFTWDWTNFHGTDYDAKSKENGIYRFIGKEWDDDVDEEFGNYDYLMGVDLDMSDEEVLEELDRWGKWYFEFTGVDGFRLDAVKHIDFSFYKNWLTSLRTHFNKPIFAVGEYWNAELSILENYIEKTEGVLSLFDVPLHFNLFHASRSNGYYDMRYILKNTLLSSRPDLAVTFVDNHDTEDGQALQSFILPWFKEHAYSIILLRREGYPCVFYGDYYGIPHNSFPAVKGLKTLMHIRRDKNYGPAHDYFNHPQIVGWTVEGDDEHPGSGYAVILTVQKSGMKRMYVGRHFAGCEFVDALGHVNETVVINDAGFGNFLVADGSVSVWVNHSKKTTSTRESIIRFVNEHSDWKQIWIAQRDAELLAGKEEKEDVHLPESEKKESSKGSETCDGSKESVSCDDSKESEPCDSSKESESCYNSNNCDSIDNSTDCKNNPNEPIMNDMTDDNTEEVVLEGRIEDLEFRDGSFHDCAEVSAYADVEGGVMPELFYGSNYTHMRSEEKTAHQAEHEPSVEDKE